MAGTNVVIVSGYGASYTVAVVDGSNSRGGLDTGRSSAVSYAGTLSKVRKASGIGGAYSDHGTFTGSTPVCVVIPYYRKNSTSSKQTTATDPDYIVALNTADSGGGTLYWVNGTTAAKTDITPESGVTFSNANCITASFGTYIAVFGTKSGVSYLYISTNGGTSWTKITALTAPQFIRGRRGDNSALRGRGQLYTAHNSAIYYSSRWGRAGLFIRNQPASGVSGFDIWG